jgi:thiol-disulfide isomerase/thioredoxin
MDARFVHIGHNNGMNGGEEGRQGIERQGIEGGKEKEKVKKAIQEKKPVYMMFYWKDCGPCKQAHPGWIDLEKKMASMLPQDALFVDIERDFIHPEFSQFFNGSFPTILSIANGVKTGEFDQDMEYPFNERKMENYKEWINKKHSNHTKTNHTKTNHTKTNHTKINHTKTNDFNKKGGFRFRSKKRKNVRKHVRKSVRKSVRKN